MNEADDGGNDDTRPPPGRRGFKPQPVTVHHRRVELTAALDARLNFADPPANEACIASAPPAAPADDDARDVRAAVRGDGKAFERIYRRHFGRVYGLCWRLCGGDGARADQATQDAFVRAWEKLESFRNEAAFSTWLHRLTVNLVLGEHRLLKRWTSLDDALDSGIAEPSFHPQATLGDRMDLETALMKLPKGARAVLVLHDIEGYQHDEIARMTGIAVGTSKAQLHRARKLMKEWLA